MGTPTMKRKTGGRAPIVAAAVIVLSLVLLSACSWSTGNTQLVREPVSQPLGDASRAEVEIAVAIGQLRIGALEQPSALVAGEIAYPERNRVTRDAAMNGDTATFRLREHDSQDNQVVTVNRASPVWDLRLSPTTPMRLTLEAGVGEGTIDLAGLQVTDLTLQSGVGNSTLTLPRRGDVKARVEGGIGNTTIIIPAGVAARIESSAGLGNVNLPADYTRQENVAVAPDFDTAANQIDLRVERGIGNITIEQSGN